MNIRTWFFVIRINRRLAGRTCGVLVVLAALLWPAPIAETPGEQAAFPATITPMPIHGELRVAIGTDPVRLDPHEATDSPSTLINHHLFEGLVTLTPRMEPVPKLARAWHSSTDGLTWTFQVRPNVVFHDGAPMDAKSVVGSFKRLLDPELGLARRGLLSPYVDRVTVVDSLTVRFHLNQPFPALLMHLAHPAAAVIRAPAPPAGTGLPTTGHPIAQPAGTGPYRLTAWTPGHRVELERNPTYWREPPPLPGLVFQTIPEASSRAILLQTGQIDVALSVSPIDLTRLENHPEVEVRSYPSLRVLYLGINTESPFLQDVRVRRALNMAVDNQALVERILFGRARPVDSPLAPEVWGHTEAGSYPYDPDQARQLLAEAGVPPGTRLTLWTPVGRYPMDRQLAEAVQGYLLEVGLRVQLVSWEWGSYLAALRSRDDYDLFLLGWAPSTGDADMGLRPILAGTERGNYSRYNNPQVNQWLDEALVEIDRSLRRSLYADIQHQVVADAPWIFLVALEQIIGVHQSVTGLVVYPTELVGFDRVYRVAVPAGRHD